MRHRQSLIFRVRENLVGHAFGLGKRRHHFHGAFAKRFRPVKLFCAVGSGHVDDARNRLAQDSHCSDVVRIQFQFLLAVVHGFVGFSDLRITDGEESIRHRAIAALRIFLQEPLDGFKFGLQVCRGPFGHCLEGLHRGVLFRGCRRSRWRIERKRGGRWLLSRLFVLVQRGPILRILRDRARTVAQDYHGDCAESDQKKFRLFHYTAPCKTWRVKGVPPFLSFRLLQDLCWPLDAPVPGRHRRREPRDIRLLRARGLLHDPKLERDRRATSHRVRFDAASNSELCALMVRVLA